MIPNFDILPAQHEFLESLTTHTAYIGGFRSGKSHIGTLKTVRKKLQNKGINVAYYLPTYGLVADVAYPLFKEHLDHIGIKYRLNLSRHEITTDWGKIIMRSMDDPNSIIGYEVGYSCMDEIDVMAHHKSKEAFIKIIARNSAITKDGVNSTDLVSTPEGFKFAYEFFKKNIKPNRKLIQVKTMDNPHLAAGYIETLEGSYTTAQLKAYLNGEFVNLTSGSVYTDFSRKENHSGRMLQPNDVLHIGIDFNITNMSASINVIDNDVKYAVNEITGAYDTFTLITTIQNRFPGHKVVAYPDASGQNRNTSGQTDVQLLIEAGFNVRVPNKNPFVKDRVNDVNKCFRNKTYFINTHNCPELTEAIEKQAYDKNGEPDKQGGFDHLCDASGYFIHMVSRVYYTI